MKNYMYMHTICDFVVTCVVVVATKSRIVDSLTTKYFFLQPCFDCDSTVRYWPEED